MQLYFPKRRLMRSFLPGGKPRIDWRNPITDGLVACYVPGSSAGNYIPNLANQGGDLFCRATCFLNPTQDGAGLCNVTGNGGGAYSKSLPTAFQLKTAGTMLWRGVYYSSGSSLGARTLIGAGATIGNGSQYSAGMVYGMQIYQANDLLLYAVGPTGDQRPTVNYNSLVTVIGTFVASGSKVLYLNGKFVSSGAASASSAFTYTPSTEYVIFCTDNNLAFPFDGTGMMGCIWNRALTQAEIASINLYPYQFLIYPEDQVFETVLGLQTTAAGHTHRHGIAG